MPNGTKKRSEYILEPETLHSDEASDIFGKLPSWTIRWGITVVTIILTGIVFACWFIKYPQTIDSDITITTLNPPADLIARTDGEISYLFVKDKEFVRKGQRVALIYNTADYNDICTVYDSLKMNLQKDDVRLVEGRWLMKDYNLGELQQTYETFRSVCMDYKHYIIADNIGRKKTLLTMQIAKKRKYRGQMAKKDRLTKEDIKYGYANEQRSEALYKKKLISKTDYEEAIRSRLQTEQDMNSSEATLTTTDLDIMQMEQQIIELDIQRDNEIAEYERQINQNRQQLLTAIEQWIYQYVVESPINGRLTFVRYWSENQKVENGDCIASIIPSVKTEVIGRMTVSSENFGKVKNGQIVNVKLNGYPYMEYGMLKGKIRSISSVPDDKNGYVVEVFFQKGLTTTYKKNLNMIQKMDGTAQIITEDSRLLDRFIQPIRALFDR